MIMIGKHFGIDNQGTIVRFMPITQEAKDWWEGNVAPPEPWQIWGSWICVDHRPARDIYRAIIEEFRP